MVDGYGQLVVPELRPLVRRLMASLATGMRWRRWSATCRNLVRQQGQSFFEASHNILLSRSIGNNSDRLVFNRPDQRSPTLAMRWAMLRMVKLRGAISPRSTSSEVQGADTGAPGLARTV